jgi:hypothetical protein
MTSRPPPSGTTKGGDVRHLDGPVALERVQVGSGRQRWIARLDPRDERRYRVAVARTIGPIERSLATMVYGTRSGLDGRPLHVGPQRRAWRRAVGTIASGATVVVSDVRRCYSTIDVSTVARALAAAAVDRGDARPVLSFLSSVRAEGLHGLPVGPEPSAPLADAVLAVADAAVAGTGARILRWVDDVCVIAPDRATAVRGFDAWARSLGALGLRPHDGKTALVDGDEARDRLAKGRPSFTT